MNEMTAMIANLAPIILMVLIFYFLLYRPQKKAQEARNKMLESLKVGSRIITIGGIYGTIVSLTDEIVTIKIADKVEVEVSRNAINGVADNKNVAT
ncbi:MAG: preprotein translocase subunit YajC [Selenomonadaceae bacterium]|nr:preprotein translocase subunit YajC [Selenomonadaceae bacterium]